MLREQKPRIERVFDVSEESVVSASLLWIPKGMTNIWEVAEIGLDDKRYMDMDKFEQGNHSLEHATWPNLLWDDFVQLVYDQVGSFSWKSDGKTVLLVSGGRTKLEDALKDALPATLKSVVNDFRRQRMGKSYIPENIQYDADTNRLYYQVSYHGHRLVWDDNKHTLEVDFVESSYRYLSRLMRRFGVPTEALRPV